MKIYLSLESLDKIRSKMLNIKEQLVKQKQDLQQKKQETGIHTRKQQNYGIYMFSLKNCGIEVRHVINFVFN